MTAELPPSPRREGGSFCERFCDVSARGYPLVNPESALNLETQDRGWVSWIVGIPRAVDRVVRRAVW